MKQQKKNLNIWLVSILVTLLLCSDIIAQDKQYLEEYLFDSLLVKNLDTIWLKQGKVEYFDNDAAWMSDKSVKNQEYPFARIVKFIEYKDGKLEILAQAKNFDRKTYRWLYRIDAYPALEKGEFSFFKPEDL